MISTQVPTVSSRYIDAKAVISLHVPNPTSVAYTFHSREEAGLDDDAVVLPCAHAFHAVW